ncbi:hypothetical protein BGZ76_000777 [Entomortierella beljakovae]|nr:hypothetical protein BGZ76_000777 [Entomortierella beljakovae]
MTKPESNNENGTRSLRSNRAKLVAVEVQVPKPTPRAAKTTKPRRMIVEEEDEDQEEVEVEKEKEQEQERTSRRSSRGTTSKTNESKSAPIPKKTAKNPPTKSQAKSKSNSKAQEEDGSDEGEEEEEEESSSEEEDDGGSDFEEPSQKHKTKATAPSKTSKKSSTGTSKTSTGKKGTKTTKTLVATARRSTAVAGDDLGADEEETSELYSAVLDSQVALDTVVSDWITEYERSQDKALLDLTNFLIRCCGCKQSILAEHFDDQEDIVGTLDDILVRYKETTVNFDYPIVSKSKELKKFRKNLLEFYTRLIQKAQSDILFDDIFMHTLLNWTISLSSTAFRPVRHTATVVALNIVSSLAELANELQEELNVTNRQLATSQKQKAAQTKIKQLQRKVSDGQSHKASVLKWISQIFDSVFILRCRDVDPLVRLDCIHELGQWMSLNPDQFIETTYIKYLGKVLSDKSPAVRLGALKALGKLNEIENQPNSLRSFTTRHTGRFIQMAVGDSDTLVRLGAIRVATLIQKHGHLEEEDQSKLSSLIFGANAKVRKSLSKFIKARIWEDEVESSIANCQLLVEDGVEVKKNWIELKSLINFLIRVSKTLSEEGDSEVLDEQNNITSTRLVDETKVGRITLAVEALWSEVEALKDWKSIAEYLLEDHTKSHVASPNRNGGAKSETLEDYYHLEEEEENILLEIFVASLQMILNPAPLPGFQKDKAKIKAQQEETMNEVGRFCIDIMPQLFTKYSVDAARVRYVLVIPQLIPLNIYLDLRMLTAFEELVDEVIKVFKKHSDPSVLNTAAATIRAIQSCEMMRNSYEIRIEALGGSIVDNFLSQFSKCQDSDIEDRETLDELSLCLRRLEHLIKCTDVTVRRIRSIALDPFEVLLKITQKYRTVRSRDAEILISALSICFLWISWICRDIASRYDQNADWKEDDVQNLLYLQESLVRIVSEFTGKESRDIDARVRRRAFQILGDLYWLFGGDMFHPSKGPNRHMLHMKCSESVQTECEIFLRSELDLWDKKVKEKMRAIRAARTPNPSENNVLIEDEGSDGELNEAEDVTEILEDEKLAAAQIEQEDKHEMFGTVFSFMRQIMLKDFTMDHASGIIARYGCFGAEYDEGIKRVVTSIKSQTTEGFSRSVRDQKSETFMNVCLESLNESFEIYIKGGVQSNSQAIQLAKLLSTAIKPPGFMQSTRIGIESGLVWDLHKRGIVYCLEKIANYVDTEDTKKSKMIEYFDVLGHIPFGAPSLASLILDLIKSECEQKKFEDIEGEIWRPIRTYQLKVEKLVQRAATEQAAMAKKAEESARLHEEQQQQQQQLRSENIEMMNVDYERPIEELPGSPVGSIERSHGKKRLAEDDEDDEIVKDTQDQGDRSESVEGSDSEDPDQRNGQSRGGSVEPGAQTKETKRIRTH